MYYEPRQKCSFLKYEAIWFDWNRVVLIFSIFNFNFLYIIFDKGNLKILKKRSGWWDYRIRCPGVWRCFDHPQNPKFHVSICSLTVFTLRDATGYQHLSVRRRTALLFLIYIARELLFVPLWADERGWSCFHYRKVSQPDRSYDQRRNWLCLLTVTTLLCFKVINGICAKHIEEITA